MKSEPQNIVGQSRPQRNSSWTPMKRDWRYATGILQHDEFNDAPSSQSLRDTLDYENETGSTKMVSNGSIERSGNRPTNEHIADNVTLTPTKSSWTPSRGSISASRKTQARYKPMSLRKQVWAQLSLYNRVNKLFHGGEGEYEITSLKIRLRLTGKNKAKLKGIIQLSPAAPDTPCPTRNVSSVNGSSILTRLGSPVTPATTRASSTLSSPTSGKLIKSRYTLPLFQRIWLDETYNFSLNDVRSTLRPASAQAVELGTKYRWYYAAVPVDAIFPPGIPMSAKEIMAFYPHHVRWESVMLRLTHNDFKGRDIIAIQTHFRGPPDHQMAPSMDEIQRQTVTRTIPNFNAARHKGKGDGNLRTDLLRPGVDIESIRQNFTLPTFGDLVHGLQHLPSGIDARGLTQCLAWYLSVRDSFTPKLELNVLHTQALIRALRQPLKSFGPQNLNQKSLQEWRDKKGFEARRAEIARFQHDDHTLQSNEQRRTQMHLDVDNEEVKLLLNRRLRYVLMFPFMAVRGALYAAVKESIQIAEIRVAARKEQRTKEEAKCASISRTTARADVTSVGNNRS